MRSHPNFGSALLDSKDRLALDKAWELRWFSVDPNKEPAPEAGTRLRREYKRSSKSLMAEAKLKREIVDNFGGAK